MTSIPICVLFGGQSGEHTVSLKSASAVLSALPQKFTPIPIGITRKGVWLHYTGPHAAIADGTWEKDLRCLSPVSLSMDGSGRLDTANGPLFPKAVFPVLHGALGEDGTTQGLFAQWGIPFVGCGCAAGVLCASKTLAKRLTHPIPNAEFLVFSKSDLAHLLKVLEQAEGTLGFPLFVKPDGGGSSLGAGIARNREALSQRLLKAAEMDSAVLCERLVHGRELEVAVLQTEGPAVISEVGEISYPGEFYDFNAKYRSGRTQLRIPAPIPEETAALCRQYAASIFKTLGCRHLARVDFFLEEATGQVLFNEINPLPGFTSTSMYPLLMERAGYPLPRLCEVLLLSALGETA